MRRIWDAARIEALRVLLAAGHSATGAAEMLSKRFGVAITRNMVIGIARRRGLKLDPPKRAAGPAPRPVKVKAKPPRVSPAPFRNPSPPVPPPIVLAIPVSARVSLIDLREGMCRFPIGEVRDEGFGFCGAPAVPGKSWCARCMSIVYEPSPARAARAGGGRVNFNAVGGE